MVDTWQPSANITEISVHKLSSFASMINNYDHAKEDLSQLTEDDIKYISSLLNSANTLWIKAIEGFSVDQIKNLCVFFTVGEMQFSTWAFGSNNPTIYFIKHLKSSDIIVEKDFIRWLKKQTDNRYIPYGSAL